MSRPDELSSSKGYFDEGSMFRKINRERAIALSGHVRC